MHHDTKRNREHDTIQGKIPSEINQLASLQEL